MLGQYIWWQPHFGSCHERVCVLHLQHPFMAIIVSGGRGVLIIHLLGLVPRLLWFFPGPAQLRKFQPLALHRFFTVWQTSTFQRYFVVFRNLLLASPAFYLCANPDNVFPGQLLKIFGCYLHDRLFERVCVQLYMQRGSLSQRVFINPVRAGRLCLIICQSH